MTPLREASTAPMNARNTNEHEEWLIDEAMRDSFPASDPASPIQPGSIVSERYARSPASYSQAT